jgi:hypothetical protein
MEATFNPFGVDAAYLSNFPDSIRCYSSENLSGICHGIKGNSLSKYELARSTNLKITKPFSNSFALHEQFCTTHHLR